MKLFSFRKKRYVTKDEEEKSHLWQKLQEIQNKIDAERESRGVESFILTKSGYS